MKHGLKLGLQPRARRFDGARAFLILQLVLVLLVPFIFSQVSGCQGEKETYAMNLGPEVPPGELDAAISAPLANTTPTSIKLGEGFIVSETQELGAGAAFTVVSDTSQTVIDRQENASEIFLTVVEHKQKYLNGEIQKTSTEIPYRIEKSSTSSLTNAAPATPDTTENSAGTKLRPEVEKMFREASPTALMTAVREQLKSREAMKALSGDDSETKVTYHSLKVVVSKEPPPEMVQRQPECLKIPDCKITVHRVSFDMVFWENGIPDRVHWDLAMSEEVPYLASMLNKCVTGLATLGENQGNILVKQCVPVVFFRYEPPADKPTQQ